MESYVQRTSVEVNQEVVDETKRLEKLLDARELHQHPDKDEKFLLSYGKYFYCIAVSCFNIQ